MFYIDLLVLFIYYYYYRILGVSIVAQECGLVEYVLCYV